MNEMVLRISSNQDKKYAKRVAGAMGWRLREDGVLSARAVGAEAVNSTVKAIAICNHRVAAANVTLGVDMSFKEAEQNTTAIEMFAHEIENKRPATFLEYKVSGIKSDKDSNAKLADAISIPIKDGKGVTLKCIGAASVFKAINASILAKGILFSNGLQIVAVPSWGSFESDGKSVSFIKIDIWGFKAEPV